MTMTTAVLNSLPARQREAIVLRYGEEMSEPDTARRMAVSERRVRYMLAAARRRLATRHGVNLRPLPVGRRKSKWDTGDVMNFDRI